MTFSDVSASAATRPPDLATGASSRVVSSGSEGEGSSGSGSGSADARATGNRQQQQTPRRVQRSAEHIGRSGPLEEQQEEEQVAALLVSVYLDKLQPGIWHHLVVGPAPLSAGPRTAREAFASEEERRSQLGVSLQEALQDQAWQRDPPQGDLEAAPAEPSRTSLDDGTGNESVLSIGTIASDDSETILGSRPTMTALGDGRPGLGGDARAAELEKRKFNLDAQSMAIIGQQVALRMQSPAALSSSAAGSGAESLAGTTSTLTGSTALSSVTSEEEAFEYYKRAWQKADVPLAITQLVSHYLPLPISAVASPSGDEPSSRSVLDRTPMPPASAGTGGETNPLNESASTRTSLNAQRQRYLASLGGNEQLARLYVSFARLHLSSSWSPLAFPGGSLNNPFVTRTQQQQSVRYGVGPGSNSAVVGAGAAAGPLATIGSNSPPASRPASIATSGSHDHTSASSPGVALDHQSAMLGGGAHRISSALQQHVGPLAFLREAARLDPSVDIGPDDWEEAKDLAEEAVKLATSDAEARRAFLEAAVAGDTTYARLRQLSAGGTVPAVPVAGSTRSSTRRRRRTRSGHGIGANDEDGGASRRRGNGDGPNSITINFVSSAALLSVCLAGSVAAFSIWKRVSAVHGGGGGGAS